MTRIILTALFGAGFGGCLLFVGLFGLRSRGWWRTDTGLNLMAMMAVMAGLFGLVVAGRVIGPLGTLLWTIGMTTLDAVIWWRVIILIKRQNEAKREERR